MAKKPEKPDEKGIEYTIYTFEHPDPESKSQPQWEKVETVMDRGSAIDKAEKLAGSGKFEKVEVKQTYFDQKKNRKIEITLKIIESKKAFKFVFGVKSALALAVLSGLVAFAVTYLLGR
ncbi:MAG: hypothetical protein KDJ15_06875 [Alphaproteobacteria bacterium]|nr:hypothetical protein [Alphaproteobacteria bacterium]